MTSKQIQILVEKYIEGTASSEEVAELMEWYERSNEGDVEWQGFEADEREQLRLKIFGAIRERDPASGNKRREWLRIAAAVALLIGLSISGYLFFQKKDVEPVAGSVLPQSISPGSNGATLVLYNGQAIALGQSATGKIAQQGRAVLQKQNDSVLVYQVDADAPANERVEYNTLRTSRGHQFRLVLADGTKVWLNAGSSLTYPTAFVGKARTVKLSGEAYFEVIHDDDQPFEVVTSKQTVRDLGTSFNISAYPDEASVKTTLIEGALEVRMSNTGQSQRLYPGEQALVDSQIRVRKADVRAVVAWKDGLFIFRSTPLRELMHQIAMWYDVEIIYKDNLADKSIWGSVSRYAQVGEVLDMIALTGIAHFEIEGRKIIVTK